MKSVLPEFIENEVLEVQTRLQEHDIEKKTAGQQLMDRVPEENVVLFRSDLVSLVQALRQRGVEPILVTHATIFGKPLSHHDQQMLTAWRWWSPQLKEEGFLDMEQRMNAAIRAVARGAACCSGRCCDRNHARGAEFRGLRTLHNAGRSGYGCQNR